MKQIFLDTNIVLRYLLGENDAPKIAKLLKSHETLIIPDIVVAEVVWTLGRFYKWPKEKTAQFLFVLLKNKNIEFNENIIFPTLSTFLKYNIRYTDAYISVIMKQSKTKDIYSFDRDFDKIPEVNRFEPK